MGPRAQKDAIDRWAKANGVCIAAVYEDRGISGGAPIEDRPGLLAAIDAIANDGAGVLVVAKRDRLARDVIVSAMIERLVARKRARVVSADAVGNGDGPEAEMMRGIVSVFAQYERALIRSRTRSALAAKRARGERTSRFAPYGFAIAPDERTLVPVADEQRVVEKIIAMYVTGASFREIARRLGGVGARGRRWYASSVASIVRARPPT